MGLGSWLRFFVGLLLSIEVLRGFLTGDGLSDYAVILAVLFFVLSIWFFVEKFLIR